MRSPAGILDPIEHQLDEAGPLGLDPRHDRAPVDLDTAVRPNFGTGHLEGACAASGAAISDLLGMQPTRAQIVPEGLPSITTARLPASTAAR